MGGAGAAGKGKSKPARCEFPGCPKGAADGPSRKCKAHGGGKRCEEPDCGKSARGSSGKCMAHGGGGRCKEEGCTKGSVDASGKCIAHGGGRRCDNEGCFKAARSGATKCGGEGRPSVLSVVVPRACMCAFCGRAPCARVRECHCRAPNKCREQRFPNNVRSNMTRYLLSRFPYLCLRLPVRLLCPSLHLCLCLPVRLLCLMCRHSARREQALLRGGVHEVCGRQERQVRGPRRRPSLRRGGLHQGVTKLGIFPMRKHARGGC